VRRIHLSERDMAYIRHNPKEVRAGRMCKIKESYMCTESYNSGMDMSDKVQ
jgi:hypothetical protein